jgi:hypothetical protein
VASKALRGEEGRELRLREDESEGAVFMENEKKL